MIPQPFDVVGDGPLDMEFRYEPSILLQPGNIEVVIRRAIGTASLWDGDICAGNGLVDFLHHVSISDQPAAGDVVDRMIELIRQHQLRNSPAAVFHIAQVGRVIGTGRRARRGQIRILDANRGAEQARQGEKRVNRAGRADPQTVPIRRFTTSNPACPPASVVKSSAVFLNAWI